MRIASFGENLVWIKMENVIGMHHCQVDLVVALKKTSSKETTLSYLGPDGL